MENRLSLKHIGLAVLKIVLELASKGTRPSLFRDVTLSMFSRVSGSNSLSFLNW